MDNKARIERASTADPKKRAPPDRADGTQDAQSLQKTLEQRLRRESSETEDNQEPGKNNRKLKRLLKAMIGVAVALVFGWVPLQALLQTSSVEAVINSRLVTLRAPIDGRVVSATDLSSERTVIHQGTVVLRIVNTRADRTRLDELRRQRDRLENEKSTLQAKLASTIAAQKDLARQSEQFREGRIKQLEARLAEIETTIAASAARREEAAAAVERASSLVRSGTVSSVELARLTRELTIARQNERAARHRLDATSVELTAVREGIFLGDSYNDRPSSLQRSEEMRQRAETLTADIAGQDAEIRSLSSEIAAEEYRFGNFSEALVKLPVAGRIWEVMTAPGEDVRAGQALVRVLDCGSALVTANVTERVYNRLHIGMPARFRPADGSVEIAGTVINLTGSAGAAANLAISPDALSKEPYRVMMSVSHEAGASNDCKVGRTGRVIFESSPAPSPS